MSVTDSTRSDRTVHRHFRSAAIALFAFLALCVTPVTPAADEGSMTIKEGVLDELTIKTLKSPDGVGVIVRRFPTDNANLGTAEKGDNEKRLDAVNIMKREAPMVLADQIVKVLGLGGTYKYAREAEGESLPEDAIVVEGRFTLINPGSRAKRWAFFAGHSGIEVAGTVKDAHGNLLAEFTHRRGSGVGLAGGDYVKFLMDDTRDVGSDIALFLKRWASGGDLSKDD